MVQLCLKQFFNTIGPFSFEWNSASYAHLKNRDKQYTSEFPLSSPMIRAFPFSVKITVVRSFVATFLDDVNGAILVTGSRVECAKSYNSTRPLAVTRANNVAMDGVQEMSLTGEHNSSFTSFCFSEKLQSLTVESAELVKKIVSSTGDILILVTVQGQ